MLFLDMGIFVAAVMLGTLLKVKRAKNAGKNKQPGHQQHPPHRHR